MVNNANGKYIIFADAAVKTFDDFVKRHVGFVEENPNVGVAFGKPMLQEGTLVSTLWNLYCYALGGFLGNDATIYCPEAIKEVCGFDPKIKGAGEDIDLINKIRAKGWLISINEKARFFHKGRENRTSRLSESGLVMEDITSITKIEMDPHYSMSFQLGLSN